MKGITQMQNVYEKHKCGGDIVDDEPSYIPLGDDTVMKIIDQKCTKCGAAIIGKHQKTEMIQNKAAHDKLMDFYKEQLHPHQTPSQTQN